MTWLRHVFALADGERVHLTETWSEHDEGVMVRTEASTGGPRGPPRGLGRRRLTSDIAGNRRARVDRNACAPGDNASGDREERMRQWLPERDVKEGGEPL